MGLLIFSRTFEMVTRIAMTWLRRAGNENQCDDTYSNVHHVFFIMSSLVELLPLSRAVCLGTRGRSIPSWDWCRTQ